MIVPALEHLDARVNQEGTEDIDDPVEPVDEFGAGEDHYHSHYKRTHDAPEEHTMLVLLGNLEEGEDQQEDEQIIHR